MFCTSFNNSLPKRNSATWYYALIYYYEIDLDCCSEQKSDYKNDMMNFLKSKKKIQIQVK